MTKEEFHAVRQKFGKTQKEMSGLLGISLKAVQSFEQGWRKVPPYVEKHLFFLFAMREEGKQSLVPCWESLNCPMKNREECPAWEFRAGRFCWLVNGTYCCGRVEKNWDRKMVTCKKCKVFRSFFTV